MKNNLIKRLLVCVIGVLFFQMALAQPPEHDFDIAIVIPSHIYYKFPGNSRTFLVDRLRQAISVNGMGTLQPSRNSNQSGKDNSEIGGSESDNCFMMFPEVNELSRNITTSPPILHTVELNLTLYIGGYDMSSIFGTYSFIIKGAGTTYEKAYLDAIKKINPKNAELQEFIVSTKSKIRKYYTENCDYLLGEAESIAQRAKINDEGYNNFMKSINILTQISKVNPKCYSDAADKVKSIYERYQRFACSYYLSMAKIQWAGRNRKDLLKSETENNTRNVGREAEREAGKGVFFYLRQIPPSPYCEKELNDFLKEIERSNVKFEDRDFNLAKFKDSSQVALEQKRLSNQSKLIDASILSSIGANSRKESATTAVNILLGDGKSSPAKKD